MRGWVETKCTLCVFESTLFPESSHAAGNWQAKSVHTKLGFVVRYTEAVGSCTGSIRMQDVAG